MRTLNTLLTVLALSFPVSLVACTDAADTSDTDADAAGTGSFDLWQSTDGWHFHLKAGNGDILLASEAYTSRTGAINGVLAIENNGEDADMYQVVKGASGYLLHLVAPNNEIIGFTQTYSSKSNATRAIGSCVHAVTSFVATQDSDTTGARVEIAIGATNQYHFNFHAANGQIVLTSESYTTEAAAIDGAMSVQDNAVSSKNFDVLEASGGTYYFNLIASNGQVIGTSQQYATKSDAQKGVTAVISLAKTVTVL